MKLADDARLLQFLSEHIAAQKDWPLTDAGRTRLARAIGVLKTRAKTVAELADQSRFLLLERPIVLDAAAQKTNVDSQDILRRLRDRLEAQQEWTAAALGDALKAFAAEVGIGMGKIGPPLRAVLTGGAPA